MRTRPQTCTYFSAECEVAVIETYHLQVRGKRLLEKCGMLLPGETLPHGKELKYLRIVSELFEMENIGTDTHCVILCYPHL